VELTLSSPCILINEAPLVFIYFNPLHITIWHLVAVADLFWETEVKCHMVRNVWEELDRAFGSRQVYRLFVIWLWAPCSSVLLQIPSLQWPSALMVTLTWL